MSQTTSTSPNEVARPQPAPAGNLRLLLLLGLLLLAVGALAYDYLVARPAVQAAYAKVQALNEEINSTASHRATTNLDVQTAIGKKPASMQSHGPYQMEVYHFASGLPLRPHKYYAIYSNGLGEKSGALVLMKHYAFEVPADDLLSERVADDDESRRPAMGDPPVPAPAGAAAAPTLPGLPAGTGAPGSETPSESGTASPDPSKEEAPAEPEAADAAKPQEAKEPSNSTDAGAPVTEPASDPADKNESPKSDPGK